MTPSAAPMQAFDAHLRALKQELTDMSEHQRMLTVVASVEPLMDFYLLVASINAEFHRALAAGEVLPLPICGTA
jgi:hypothetical protein